jgi:predicted site-specific integrase-resolvase
MTKRYLKICETAELLSINQKTAYSWAARGILPTIRIGGALRVDSKKLEEKFEAQLESWARDLNKNKIF